MKRIICIISALLLTLLTALPSYAGVELPPLCLHAVYEWVIATPATCTEAGEKAYTCAYCGHVLNTEVIPATGHQYESEITTNPTYTDKGVRTYTCTLCEDTYTEEIDKLEAINGDINLDGRVNVLDLIAIKLHLSGKKVLPSDIKTDVTGDGRVNVLDLIRMKLVISGKVEEF